ncbi:dihydrolipoamide acetyltransferase family protein [Dactylosporangium sp. NPDC000244]|uniref:dihydrolipoamide acetyltransferase family protein n=1 Tax=Dactylosporangium sp. NPDC000244 TaxID=3154365 RepID=UPI00331F0CF9
MTVPDFLLPDLGEGLEEAEIITWHVKVGDQVAIDQIVVEVETAKAAVEVPVPFAGTVATLHATPGNTVQVGQPLISIDTATVAGRDDNRGGFREPGAITPDAGVTPADEASGNVLIGYGTSTATSVRRRRRSRTPRADRLPIAQPDLPATATTRVISPLVRKLARDAGVDLTSIRGTGASGIIRRFDIEQAILARQTGLAAHAGEPEAAKVSPVGTGRETGETRIPLRGLRRAVAEKLSRSRREIPEATVWVDVDATELLATRAAINAAGPEQPVSLLALLTRFTILALRRYPELNAHIDGDEIVIPDHVHLGFAAQTDRGLVVPVIRNAHRLSTRDLSAALASRTAAARSGGLAPSDLTGGTVTVNNYGVFGVDGSAAIINHPEVAIVGLGRIIARPWVVDDELTVRKVGQLTLAFDHRVCDGGTAGGFLRYLANCIEHPVTALGDL